MNYDTRIWPALVILSAVPALLLLAAAVLFMFGMGIDIGVTFICDLIALP